MRTKTFLIISSIVLMLVSISPLQAETSLYSEQLTIDTQPLIEKVPDGLFVRAPIVNNLVVLIVRVVNNKGKQVLYSRTNGESVELLASNLPDGEYRYQIKTLYRIDISANVDPEVDDEVEIQTVGRFIIENNELTQPDIQAEDEDLSFLEILRDNSLVMLGKSLEVLVSSIQAADLEASSAIPRLKFNDTTSSATCCEWWMEGEGSSTAGRFKITDLIGSNNHDVIVLKGAAGVTDSLNSMVVETNGDISWGDSAMFFSKNGGNLSLGSLVPPSDLSIFDANPTFRLHDETDTSEVQMELANGLVKFIGRPVETDPWHSIVSFETAAPIGSLKIDDNGYVRMGDGFVYDAIHNTVHIGDGASVLPQITTDLMISDDTNTADIILDYKGTAGVQLEMGSSFRINMDSDGDGTMDNSSVFSINKTAPAFSVSISSIGNIRWADNSMYLDKSTQSLALGTTTPLGDFTIKSVIPDIRLHDESDTSEAGLELNNGTVIFKGRSADSNPLNSIFTYHTDAPNSSLNIFNTGDVRMGTGFRYHENGASSTLHIGGNTTATQSLVLTSSSPELLLSNPGNSGAEMRMTNNTFGIGMDTDGDGVVNTTNVFSVDKLAPANSLMITDLGDLSWGTGAMYLDSSAQRLALGTSSLLGDLTIASTNPMIYLFDETDNKKSFIELENGELRFWVKGNLTTAPFKIEVGAPDNRIRLKSNGDISWSNDAMNFIYGSVLSITNLDPALELAVGAGGDGAYLHPEGGEMRFYAKTSGSTYERFPLSFSLAAPSDSLSMNASGNVGVGTNSPTEAMTIQRTDAGARMQLTGISSAGNEAPQMIWKRARSNAGVPAAITVNDNLGAFSFRGYTGSSYSGSRGFINVQATENWTPTANGTRMLFQTTENGTSSVRTVMEITHDGKVKINGSTLAVPDYVFEEDYELMSLDQLSAFIEQNKHLPGVASAKEVNAQGLDLAGSQLSVLEKVEELTLYTLQLHENQKQMEFLKAENMQIKSENSQLKIAHSELLKAFNSQQQKLDKVEQLVNQIIQSQEGNSIYTSLK